MARTRAKQKKRKTREQKIRAQKKVEAALEKKRAKEETLDREMSEIKDRVARHRVADNLFHRWWRKLFRW